MKHLAVSLTALVILASATAFSLNGASQALQPQELKIDIKRNNPWTNLRFNNREENFQFAIVTDRTGGRRPGVFTRAVEKLNLLQPEFVMSVGDLIQGATEERGMWALEWSEFQSKVEQLEMPFFYCPGNHDINNIPMSEEWHRKFGRSYYNFVYRDVLFLILNSEDPPPSNRDGPYGFSTKQQQWAVDTLARHPDVRWTFVFLHKPTWDYPDFDPQEGGWSRIEDALQDRLYTVFAGHKHNYAKFDRKGREYYMLATTGGGSGLSGLANGEFDHIVWVTMNDDEPVIANVLLDGIEDENVRVLPDPMPDR